MKEWNIIRKQYGLEPSLTFPNNFEVILGEGTKVMGIFYGGGNTNPTGFTIKINTYLPKPVTPMIKKIPPVYLRYQKFKN